MVTKVDYALLADAAYRSIRGAENQPVIPADWVRLDRAQFGVLPATSRTGFSAEIFRNRVTGEVVISYQGTNPDLFTGDAYLDWTTNLATGLGSDSGQLKQAAQLYRRVAAAYGEETISFTGHSLGGGLASLMAVFFDRPAQVFAPAPFESAASVQVARIVQSLLGAAFRDQRLDAYVANQPAAFAAREQNVEGHYVIGEVVGLIRTQSGTIARWELTPYNLGATLLGGMDLHSMQVHVAAISNETFQQASRALPQLLALIADTSLFAVALRSDVQKDFLQQLLEFQFGQGSPMANGLDRFAVDANSIGARAVAGTQRALVDGVLQVLLQRYSEASTSPFSAQFMTAESGGVSFDMSQVAGGNVARVKGYGNKLATLLGLEAHHGLPGSAPLLPALSKWYVQLGQADSGRIAVSGTDANELFWGGDQGDQFTGGKGNDVFFGGLGSDSYRYEAGDGADTIYDSDRQGQIFVGGAGGFVVTGGESAPKPGIWRDDAHRLVFTKQANDLVISGEGLGGGGNTITVREFVNGDLGIDLRRAAKIELLPGATGKNPFLEAGHEAAQSVVSSMKEGGAKAFTVALGFVSSVQETISIKLGDFADKFKAIIGDEIVDFQNGEVQLTVAPGQSTVSFGLLEQGDIDTSSTTPLTATLLNASGPAVVSNAVSLNLEAVAEPDAPQPPVTTRDILGDQTPLDPAQTDDLGNLITDGTPALNRADTLNGSTANDAIVAGGGDDTILATQGGDDFIDAGPGDDNVSAGPNTSPLITS